MHPLTGTFKLFKLALRRDRVKLPIVIALITVMFASSVAATVDLYQDPAQRAIYAATMATSVVGRVFGGALDSPAIGSIVQNETYLFTALAVAFMSTLTVVRHTRQNEEAGRNELIESGVVARHASLAAALITAGLASLLFGMLATVSLLVNDLPLEGSLMMGASMTFIGISFAGIAAVTAQLVDSARGANSLAALAVGIAFLLRAVGDGMGSINESGLGVESNFASWMTPLGWGAQIYPFGAARSWVFLLFSIQIIISLILAVVLMARRDIGLGMISTRPGRARAKAGLLSTFGLARRLQAGILRGWVAALLVLGVSFGAVTKEFENMIAENPEMAEMFAQFGGSLVDSFLSFMVNFIAILIGGYAVQSLLRARSEESGGQLESILGTAAGRTSWLASHTMYMLLGVLVLASVSAAGMGGTFVLTTGADWIWVPKLILATIVQSAAVLAVAGFAVALFGFIPRMAVPLAWGAYAFCVLILNLGALLKLPSWVMNLSPFVHVPLMPSDAFAWEPVLWLILASGILGALGFIRFQNRDLSTE